jgi:hypothetical protein
MNSKITSFDFKNCNNLKKIYISPTCELEGKITLFDTQVKESKKYDEYQTGGEGFIFTSEAILNQYVRIEKGN